MIIFPNQDIDEAAMIANVRAAIAANKQSSKSFHDLVCEQARIICERNPEFVSEIESVMGKEV